MQVGDLVIQRLALGINERGKVSNGPPPMLKLRNLKPRLDNGVLALSTFCVDELSAEHVWNLLDSILDKPAHAKAELSPDHVEDAGLRANPDWVPDRHVNIVDWPQREEEIAAAAQVLYAKQVCTIR